MFLMNNFFFNFKFNNTRANDFEVLTINNNYFKVMKIVR